MKKLVLALSAVAAFSASAMAADLAPRPYAKAPAVVAPVPTWTGFWISGGFGYGMMEYQHSQTDFVAPFAPFGVGQDAAGKGWLGKVGLGYDYQFMGNFVIGAFADTQWSNIGGQTNYFCPNNGAPNCVGADIFGGPIKNDWSWSVGGRIGYVALPGLLTYFNAGFSQAHFQQTNYFNVDPDSGNFGLNTGLVLPSRTRNGYFIGGGTEYAVSLFPGLFWKNEVRFSDFGNQTTSQICTVTPTSDCGTLGAVQSLHNSHVYEQAATTELVYRFNWGGSVVAKY